MATNPTGGTGGTQGSGDEFKNLIGEVSKIQINFAAAVDSAREMKKALKDTSAESALLSEYSTKVKNIMSDTFDLAAKLGTEYITQEQVQARIDKNKSLAENASIQKGNILSRLKNSESFVLAKIADLQDRGVAINKKNLSVDEYRLFELVKQEEALKDNLEQLDKINNNLDKGNKIVKDSTLRANVLAKAFGSLSRIPFLKDLINFKVVSEAFKKGFGAGIRSLGAEIGTVLKSPLFLTLLAITAIVGAFKALVKLAFDYDKIVTDIANNTALSKTSAVGMLDAYRDISDQNVKLAAALDSGFLSVKNQANALIELGSTLETNAMFTNEMVQNQILLTKQMKMSAEEAAGIQKFSLLTGQSAEKILNTAMKQNTTVISYRKIFSQIAKINSELAVAYKNNPELIAKAVVQANKLGMSLEDTQKISKSLLDFENSIAGELEAELLLGKQFNFEKARALALDGKSAEAAAELVNQMGGLNALTNMNVIQRDRLAASIGLSAEELTKSAREQAVLNALGEQNRAGLEERYEYLRKTGDLAGLERLKAEAARKEGGQALLQDIARANLQDRFNESMERIKQIFTEVAAGPMIKLISGFAKMLENTTLVKGVMIGLAALAAMIATSVIIASGGLALVAAGIAATATGYALYKGDEYGKTDMAAATLPNRASNLPTANMSMASSGGAGSTNDATLKAIQDLHDTVKRGGNVYMDSTKVGTAMGMSSHKSGR